MSGRPKCARSRGLLILSTALVPSLLFLICAEPEAAAQQRREREPNSVYAERRAKLSSQLSSQVDGPIILWGFTGREESSQAYVFAQEESFYYLTGHNEEGAGLIIVPELRSGGGTVRVTAWDGPQEMLFLPAKDPAKEKWNGVRMSPSDPGIEARTGFSAVKPFKEMHATIEKLADLYPSFYTILPYERELGGYPHE